MGSILAIDFGLKRIGLAVSDPDRVFAFPRGILENKNFDFVISHIKKIIEEKEVDLIVVGIPYNKDPGRDNPGSRPKKKKSMEEIITDFIKKLEKEFDLPIKTFDESLTSFQAEENFKEIGMSSKKSKKFIDEEAARIILEGFLQMNK